MCCKTFWKRIVPFAVTLVIALMFTDAFQNRDFINVKNLESSVLQNTSAFNYSKNFTHRDYGNGIAIAACSSDGRAVTPGQLHIISKPRAVYTVRARENNVQGTVTLRATFLANGKIANVTPVRGLPDGLTEQSISAVKRIKFEPAVRDGRAITVTKQVQYSFTIC